MKHILIIFVIFSICSCVRLPDDYAYTINRGVDTNEQLLKKIETSDMTLEKKNEYYIKIIEEDNKTMRAIAATILKGGGS